MPQRRKDEGRVYLRRSTGKQESGMYSQLEWFLGEARAHGVKVDADKAALDHMLKHRLTRYKSIFLDDGITGADLSRPGFTAFRREALANPAVSHLFIHMPDRFSRTEFGYQAMGLEQELLYAGITVVFSNRLSKPRRKGENYFGEDMQMLYSYMESGDYLNKLAVRVIETQAALARKGHWTGGQPPYGFIRVRVGSDGSEQEMERGTSIRQPGSHTEIRPKDAEKISVWVMALDWCERRGWGCKRIAKELNALGIPSPDAGRTRTENGHRHRVSGLWSPSTVRALLRNTAIMGVQRYGVQAEGHHRRLGENGPRLLDDNDQRDDKPRVVTNPDELVIRSVMPGFEPPVKKGVFEAAQAVLDERGKHQRGISKTKDPSRYPLATRIYDLNCGYPMYGKASGERKLYSCGRYINTDGQHCDHNQVDAEATLAYLLALLREQVVRRGGREVLKEKVLKLIKAAGGDANGVTHERRVLTARLRSLEQEFDLLGTNLARAGSDAEYKVISRQFQAKLQEVEEVKRQLEQMKPPARSTGLSPEDQAEQAMELFDQIELMTEDADARAALRPAFKRLNLNLWLSFGEGRKGKRKVRQLRGGVLTAADQPFPVRPYGEMNDEENDGDRPARAGAAAGALPAACDKTNTSSASVSQQEDVSLSKVHRGDPRFPLVDETAGLGLLRHFLPQRIEFPGDAVNRLVRRGLYLNTRALRKARGK